jgi:O-antigen polymerase
MKNQLQTALCITLIALPWLWAIDLGPLAGMLGDLVAWIAAALLVCLIPQQGSRRTEAIAWGLLLAGLANVLISLLQYFNLEDGFFPAIANTELGIAYGNVRQANLLSSLLSAALLSLLYLRKTTKIKFAWTTAFGFLLMTGYAITASRTGLVQLLLILALLTYWRPWSLRLMLPWMLAGIFILFAAGVLLPYLLTYFHGVEAQRQLMQRFTLNDGCFSRWLIWSNVWELIQLRPWTGWGWDGLLYAHYIHPFSGERACMKLSNAHNLYLQWAVEYGLPTATLAVVMILGFLWRLKPWLAKENSERFGWGILVMIGFHSLVEFPLWFGNVQLMTGLALLLVISPQLQPTPVSAQQILFRLRLIFSTIAIAVLSFIAYDYHRISQLYLPVEWRSQRYLSDTFNQAQKTVLFKSHALIYQVVYFPIHEKNAALMLQASEQALHIAPDSRIIRRLLESANYLGREDLIVLHEARYKAAWPKEYAEWLVLTNRKQ